MANQGLGLEALVPNGLLGGSSIGNYSRKGLTKGVRDILDALSNLPAARGASINSGYRSPSRNQSAGGAKRSQHLRGNAIDINISKLSAAEKKAVLDAAIAAGARGIGVYKSGNVLHVDPRAGAAVWGPSPRGTYRGLRPSEYGLLPDWARASALGVLGGKVPTPGVAIPDNVPLPTPRPPDALNVAVNRAPLAPPQDFVRPMPSGLRPSAPAPMATMERARPMPTGPLPQAAPVSLPPDRPVPMGPLAQPQAPPPAVDPKVLAAYQQMAASRMAAPLAPVPTPRPTLAAPQVPVPPSMPPSMPQTPGNFPDVPPAAPPSRPMDVWSGLADTAQDSFGNTVANHPGGVAVTNRFGATTIQRPDGTTAAVGGPLSGINVPDAFQPDETLGGRSPVGNFARQGVGGLGGAAVGGLLGPVGALLGGLVGRELAKPGGGKIGDFVNGVRTINGMQFARPQGGLAFPSAPGGGNGRPYNYSERSDREMRDISPKAARDIAKGRGGLF